MMKFRMRGRGAGATMVTREDIDAMRNARRPEGMPMGMVNESIENGDEAWKETVDGETVAYQIEELVRIVESMSAALAERDAQLGAVAALVASSGAGIPSNRILPPYRGGQYLPGYGLIEEARATAARVRRIGVHPAEDLVPTELPEDDEDAGG